MTPGAWRVAPGVLRLRDGRLAGGSPYRITRLSPAGQVALAELLGTRQAAAPGSRSARASAALADRLVRYGMLLAPAPEPVAVADVTVVIPALAAPDCVAAAIGAVPADVPIVLVDDGCPVPLAGTLARRLGLTHLRHETPLGPGAARNAGAGLVGTRWIAFLDCDVRPGDGWLAALLAHAADRDVVAVAPRVRSVPTGGLAGLVETYAGALDLGDRPCEVTPGGRVSYVPSAALLVRRDAFEQAGGFDATLQVGEDVDLVWRLRAAGRVRYQPETTVWHLPRTGVRSVAHRRYRYGTSAAALDQRHPGALRHADVTVWTFVPWLLAVLIRPRAGLLAAAAMTAAAPLLVPALPARDAIWVVARAQLTSQLGLDRWLLRPMWPLTAVLVLLAPYRPRRAALALAAVGAGLDIALRSAQEQRTAAGTVRAIAAHLLDDLAYSAGVWSGCLRGHRCGPLVVRVRRPRRASGAPGAGGGR